MRGKPRNPPNNPVAVWIDESMDERGIKSIRTLAAMSGVSQARITQIRNGDTTTRDMIRRLATAFGGENEDDPVFRASLRAGLNAAGFTGQDDGPIASITREAGYDPSDFNDDEMDELRRSLRAFTRTWLEEKRRHDNRDS